MARPASRSAWQLSIPPHNLSEIVDALVYMLDRWEKLDDIDVDQ